MASFKFLENDFTGGQISPLLNRRSNAQRYTTGLRTLQNMTIMLQGGVTTRPATEYITEVKDSSKLTELISFEFSTIETYGLEMGDQYFRFLKESGQVLEADITITDITQADPGVVTVSGTAPANGDQVYITEVVGMSEVNHSRMYYTVANRTATTFELQDRDGNNVDTSGFTAYSSGGVVNTIYEISSPYLEADLSDIQYTQSADVISLVHEDYAPRDLTRTSDTSWSLSETEFVDGPYQEQNLTNTTLTPSGGSYSPGDVPSITASSTTGINGGDGFQTTDVGRLLRILNGSDWAWGVITARSSTTAVTVEVMGDVDFPSSAVEEWRLGAFSDTTGYPRAIAYFQQRRFYAGTKEQPDTIWGSAVDDYTNFTPGVDDADSVEYIVASNKVNAIYWLAAANRLRIGTSGGVHSLWGGSTTTSITPTNVEADQENSIRCKRLQPIENGNITLFAQRSGKILRELVYDFQVDSLVARNITLASEDILGNPGDNNDRGVIRMALQQEPTPIIWCVKDDGDLAALTYSKETDVVAWHNHKLGGTNTKAESIVSIPGTGQDRLFMIVNRTIDGVTRRYIERMSTTFRNSINRRARVSDSHVIFTGETPASTLTPGAATGDSITFTAGSSVFASTDVGRIIEYEYQDSTGASVFSRALITSYSSGTSVDANILRDFPSTDAISSGYWTLSTNTYERLDHLEGESVSILADGGTKPNQVVTNGTITLNGQYTNVTIGLGFTQEIELLDVDFGSAVGTAFSSQSKINEISIDLYESMGGFIGYSEEFLTEIVYRQGNSTMNEGLPLFTGVKSPRPKGGWRQSIKTLIRQTDPLPLTVLGMTIKGTVSDATG